VGTLYTLHGGAVLRGTGIVGAAVHTLENSTLAPGNAIGTLTFNGNAELDGVLQIELDGTGLGASDMLVVIGQLDISQALLDFNALTGLDDSAYIFASYGSLVTNVNGFFDVVDLPTGYAIDYNYLGNQIALVIPEPSTFALVAAGMLLLGAVVRRRRP